MGPPACPSNVRRRPLTGWSGYPLGGVDPGAPFEPTQPVFVHNARKVVFQISGLDLHRILTAANSSAGRGTHPAASTPGAASSVSSLLTPPSSEEGDATPDPLACWGRLLFSWLYLVHLVGPRGGFPFGFGGCRWDPALADGHLPFRLRLLSLWGLLWTSEAKVRSQELVALSPWSDFLGCIGWAASLPWCSTPGGGPPIPGLAWPGPPLLCFPPFLTLVRPHSLCPPGGGVTQPQGGCPHGTGLPPRGVSPPFFVPVGPTPPGGVQPGTLEGGWGQAIWWGQPGGVPPRVSVRAWAAPFVLWGRGIESGAGGGG